MSSTEQLREALGVLTPVLDIVGAPVESAEPPAWCMERGWAEFLLSLGEQELRACEESGLERGLQHVPGAPRDLVALAGKVRQATALPRFRVPALSLPPAALRGVPARKREQLGALLGVAAPLAARAARVVDVGAGSGHLARLSAELFRRETLAIERESMRLRTAQQRTEQRAQTVGPLDVRFAEAHVGLERLELERTDLAVGLHACGELGERLVLAAAAARCDLLLCSCCFQKIAGAKRAMLSQAGGTLALEKPVLGLANLTSQAMGVEASLGDNLRGRQARLGLRHLLQARGLALAPGEEMRGVNRRRAQAGFSELAATVLAARQLPPPTPAELRQHAARAEREHAAVRRLSLPRHLLSRLVEVTVVLDRGALLEEKGQFVLVAELFEQRITPRNTVLLATADRDRLLLTPCSERLTARDGAGGQASGFP
ncbi:MAG TPA: methyltransferase [Polyangiaceae bacterium]|nr:methyltransferase [Polyangiaceae bacterium]